MFRLPISKFASQKKIANYVTPDNKKNQLLFVYQKSVGSPSEELNNIF